MSRTSSRLDAKLRPAGNLSRPSGCVINQPVVHHLSYRLPFDWNLLLAVFRAHQLPYVEMVDEFAYERVIRTARGDGWFRVEHDVERRMVRLRVWNAGEADIDTVKAAVATMFDLAADPQEIESAMRNDSSLWRVWTRYPGLRIARSWDRFETIITTILGQLVSVPFAHTLTEELMKAAGPTGFHPKTSEPIYFFPTPEELLQSDLSTVRTSQQRRTAVRHVAELAKTGMLTQNLPKSHADIRKLLLSLPGIGAWTAEYIAMRTFGDDDAFPKTDYGLKQELSRNPDIDVNRVRPWRAYAATALWRSFVQAKDKGYESLV